MKYDNQTDIIIAGFLPWVEQQPADGEYNYTDIRGCAFAQYLHALGFDDATVWPSHFGFTKTDAYHLPDAIEVAVHGRGSNMDAQRATWTFGQLAARLRGEV